MPINKPAPKALAAAARATAATGAKATAALKRIATSGRLAKQLDEAVRENNKPLVMRLLRATGMPSFRLDELHPDPSITITIEWGPRGKRKKVTLKISW